MFASSDMRWLQGGFSTLVGLFDRVVLNTNSGKTFVIVCRLFQSAGIQSEAAYGIHITGAGPSNWERQRVWLQCTECGEEMVIGLLAVHMQTHHGKEAGGRRNW